MSQFDPSTASEEQPEQPQPSAPQGASRTPAEWVTFGIASSVLLAIVGLVSYTWLDKQQQQPPTLVVKQGNVRESNGQFYLPFEIMNTGGETAESVQVLAELRVNGKVEETGEQQIDFLSGGEMEEGAFIFSRNPQQAQINLRVASYKLP